MRFPAFSQTAEPTIGAAVESVEVAAKDTDILTPKTRQMSTKYKEICFIKRKARDNILLFILILLF